MAHTHGTEAETRKIGSLQLSPTYWNFVLEIKPQLGILIPLYRTQDFTTPCWLGCFPHSVTTQANNLDPNTSLRGTEHNHLLLGGKDYLLQLNHANCLPTCILAAQSWRSHCLPLGQSEGIAIRRPPSQRNSGLPCPTLNCSILIIGERSRRSSLTF